MSGNIQQFQVTTFLGSNPYNTLIDSSKELSELVQVAESYQPLPFEEKLKLIRELSAQAMQNAMLLMCDRTNSEDGKKSEELMMQPHPLGDALRSKIGCCRYQGILFFLLSEAGKLGSKHYIQSAPINPYVNSVFNEVYNGDQKVIVSIFNDSLPIDKKKYCYPTTICEKPNRILSGKPFLAYTIDGNVVQRYIRSGCHFDFHPNLSGVFQKSKIQAHQI